MISSKAASILSKAEGDVVRSVNMAGWTIVTAQFPRKTQQVPPARLGVLLPAQQARPHRCAASPLRETRIIFFPRTEVFLVLLEKAWGRLINRLLETTKFAVHSVGASENIVEL